MVVLRGKNKLKGTEIHIKDFPKEIRDQRRELIKHMGTARGQGYKETVM